MVAPVKRRRQRERGLAALELFAEAQRVSSCTIAGAPWRSARSVRMLSRLAPTNVYTKLYIDCRKPLAVDP
jgi:hypothetical protein